MLTSDDLIFEGFCPTGWLRDFEPQSNETVVLEWNSEFRNIQPRLMNLSEAAFYCGMSPTTFKAKCPVRPLLYVGSRAPRFDRKAIDAWLDDHQQEGVATTPAEAWLEKL
jgi:hypothetical protein